MNHDIKLLSKIASIQKEFPEYEPRTEYNPFRVLEITANEVVMCRFLADLLNPDGQHSCGTLFLQSFLRNVLKRNDVSEILAAHTKVVREQVIEENRRIDILIQNVQFQIPIEVKLYADDQKCQCYDYYRYAKNSPLIYLTRFGDHPSLASRRSKDWQEVLSSEQVRCISWSEDICGWLTDTLPLIKEPVKTTVMQYIDAIHMIAEERDKKVMKQTLEVLCESKDFFQAGLEIETSMKQAKL